jgi:hypothetical protein
MSATAAMAEARRQNPRAFAAFQGAAPVSKGGNTFENLVQAEIKKFHVSRGCAEQRVINSYGSSVLGGDTTAIRKRAEALETEFIEKAADLYNNSDLDRVSALRAARLMNKKLWARMQRA